MTAGAFPSARNFQLRYRLLQTGIGVPAACVIATYLVLLLRFTPAQWDTFLCLLATFAVVATGVTDWLHGRLHRPIRTWLDARDSEEARRRAFAAASALPRRVSLHAALTYATAGVWLGIGMEIAYRDFGGWVVGQILVATAAGGLAAAVYNYFATKRFVAPAVREIARAIPPAERARLSASVPLRTKLLLSFSGVSISTVIFALLLAEVHALRPLEAQTVDVQGRLLARLAAAMGTAGEGEAVAAAREALRELGLAEQLLVVDPAREPALPLSEHEQSVLLGQHAAGNSTSFDSPNVFTWRPLPDGRLLLAVLPSAALGERHGSAWHILAALFVVACGASVLVARTVAQDVASTSRTLVAEAGRIAQGDLRRSAVHESEDELGELSLAFDRMREALRATVSRATAAADRLESSSGEMASLGGAVARATAEQVGGIRRARESTDAVREQVGGIADSAQALNVSVEESSSSILEMGAAGEELNQTAQVLASQVEEVARSIEELIERVGAMGGSVEELSETAGETQSSLEEMAGSLREVDANAADVGRLSSEVVAVAEGGRLRVQETIAGMEAIRDATDVAERVIRALGDRASEIGAIVDVIDDVADETNLLALNAAIIAAQAGEHGRGFSVVADEIKELADRVMASTKEIGGLIASVQEESTAAIGAIERGSESVMRGVERSAEAGESLEVITGTARESGQRIGEIVGAVQEQAKAAGAVQGRMEQVRSAVEALRAATAEQGSGHAAVLRGTGTMREVARQVNRTTEEQARGAGRIRESVENVRLAAERIHTALQEQRASCEEGAAHMTQVDTHARANDETAGRMGGAVEELRDQAERLRQEVQRFRV